MTQPTREVRTRPSGWIVAAVVVALLLVAGGVAALVWARADRDDARARRTRLETELVAQQGEGSPDRLVATQAAIADMRSRLEAIPGEMQAVTDLQQQDVARLREALDAGKQGDVPAYNEAVTKRNVLAPQVDAAIEKLRVDVNAVLLALAKITNRTAP